MPKEATSNSMWLPSLVLAAIAATSYLAGFCIDIGVSPKTFAAWTGVSMLIPAIAWAKALGRWKAPPR